MSFEIAPTREVKARTTKGRVVKTRVFIEPVESDGLGFSIADLNPFTIAQKVQAGADRLATNIQTGVTYVQGAQQKLDTLFQNVATAGTHTAAAVQGAARGGIAAGATGDVSSGLLGASLMTKPVLVAGGVLLAMWVFMKHPGKRGW